MSTSPFNTNDGTITSTARFDTAMDLGSSCVVAHGLLDTLRRVMCSQVLTEEAAEQLRQAHNQISDAMRLIVQPMTMSIAKELGYRSETE